MHEMVDMTKAGPTRSLLPWLYAALACAVLVLLAMAFIDRPVARFAHATLGGPVYFHLQQSAELLAPLSSLIVVVLGLYGVHRRGLVGTTRVLMLAALSYIVAIAIKDQLKYAFGRTWPETWIANNPSYIKDGVFGFAPFHGGAGWASFPSGHTTSIVSVMAVLWLAWPQLRALWALATLAVLAGLIGMDFHWVSDCIAGGFLGTAVAVGSVRLVGLVWPER